MTLAANPSNPLDHAGGTSAAAPLPASGGGVLTIGPTTYAVSSIGAVQVQTSRAPLGLIGVLFIAGAVLCGLFLLPTGLGFLVTMGSDASVGDRFKAAIAFIGAAVLVLMFGMAARSRFRRRRNGYQVAIFVAGQPHVFIVPDEASAFRLREQIVAVMAAGGGNVYYDNRQVHLHRHG